MSRTSLAIFLVAITGGAAVEAATVYSTGPLSFQTEQRQSAWGPGAAQRIASDAPIFIGPEPWNTSFTIGDIVGGTTATTFRNPVHLAWSACRLIPFARCGNEPRRNLRVTLDTRTGAEATIASSGRIGLEASYALDAGSVAASLDFVAEASLPAENPAAGSQIALAPKAVFASGKLDSQSPTAEAKIDVVTQANLFASAQACLIGAGCTSGQTTLLNINDRRELISADPNGVTYLDGFLPSLVELSTPLLERTVALEADLVTKRLQFQVRDTTTNALDTESSKTVEGNDPVSSGLFIELANIQVQAPLLAQEAEKKPGEDHIAMSGQSPFIEVNADLDGLLTYANVLPPLGVGFDLIGVLSGSIDLIDAEAGPKIDIFQDFKLFPELFVDLSLSNPVMFEGLGLLDRYVGAWDALPSFTLLEDTIFSPIFSVEAMLQSKTGLQLGAQFGLDVLKGGLALSAGGISFFNADFGPLIEETFPFEPDFLRFALFDETFRLGGFAPLAGQDFMLALARDPAVAPIPLPGGAWLMVGAFGALALARRRRAAASAG